MSHLFDEQLYTEPGTVSRTGELVGRATPDRHGPSRRTDHDAVVALPTDNSDDGRLDPEFS
jgi:hypothetical protein